MDTGIPLPATIQGFIGLEKDYSSFPRTRKPYVVRVGFTFPIFNELLFRECSFDEQCGPLSVLNRVISYITPLSRVINRVAYLLVGHL